MEDPALALSAAGHVYLTQLGRKQVLAFAEEALKAAELWYQHEVNPQEIVKADDARRALTDLLDGLDD